MKFGLVVGCHWVCENVLCFLLLGKLVREKQKGSTWIGTREMWEIHPQEMWMDSRQGGVWSLPWSGQSSGCWGKSFFQFLLLCSVFCLFLTTDIPWVCFALCCSGFRRTQSKDSEWTFESSPGGEAQQQPNLAVWNAAGERALGRSEPGSISSAPSEVQKHQRKDRCSLCGCH